MPEFQKVIDMMGREVKVPSSPKNIISLVPSQTEFLLDIGAPVVGRTKFCIHPADKVKNIPIIGGTKNFRFEEIKNLNPDLIIGNKEENYQDGIEILSQDFPVWISDIYTLDDAFEMMAAIGSLCALKNRAQQVIKECQEATSSVKGSRSGKVIYLIWNNPWMAAGKNTFIHYLLTHLGYENVVKEERYPELTNEQIQSLDPDYILFSSEPYPFKDSHISQAEARWPKSSCQLVDGELFSWYGSRLRKMDSLSK